METTIDIKALKAGDERAFRALVDLFQDRVFNTCLGFLNSREEAEDAAQETFWEVFYSVENFREESAVSTWIYRIAVTKSLQAIRKKRRRKRFALFYASDPGEEIPDSSETSQPLAQLENQERAAVLRAAMNKLPESQRAAMTLHKIEGLSCQEISGILNVSLSSVESLIHRAKINLRKHLSGYYREQK